MDYHLPRPAPTTTPAHRSRFSMRFGLTSLVGTSSLYSNSPRMSSSPQPKPDRIRFTLNSVRDARTDPTSAHPVRGMRSRSSTRSIIDASTAPIPCVEPLDVPRSWYGTNERLQTHGAPQELPSPTSSNGNIEETVLLQDANTRRRSRTKYTKRYKAITREAFHDPRVRAKASLSIAFGITLFAALAVYLSLAIANVGSGAIYHTIFILLILGLMGAFVHSLLRMFMLIIRPQHSQHTRRTRRTVRNQSRSQASTESPNGLDPEKPIRIILASDEDEEAALRSPADVVPPENLPAIIRPPPPVYGEVHGSTRMNPTLVHWQKSSLPPSPLTPTYDQALVEVHEALGREYRPPSYMSDPGRDGRVEHEAVTGLAGRVEMGEGEVLGQRECAELDGRELLFGEVHPLERERVVELMEGRK